MALRIITQGHARVLPLAVTLGLGLGRMAEGVILLRPKPHNITAMVIEQRMPYAIAGVEGPAHMVDQGHYGEMMVAADLCDVIRKVHSVSTRPLVASPVFGSTSDVKLRPGSAATLIKRGSRT